MRNLTVKIPDEIYLAARRYAAEQNTSVADVFKDFLATLNDLNKRRDKLKISGAANLHLFLLKEFPGEEIHDLPLNAWEHFFAVKKSVAEQVLSQLNQAAKQVEA
jgi:hypothetical protein